MKALPKLFLALATVLLLSCKKDSVSQNDAASEKTSANKVDFRDKFVGKYDCQLHSREQFYDANNAPYIKDTTYSIVVQVYKGSGETISLQLFNGSTSDLAFYSKSEFSGARIHGSFFRGDSLFIDNSHPTYAIFSYIYHGKKID